jgi:hypothetical protein
MGKEVSTATMNAAPPGIGHPENKVPGPPDWWFHDGLVTRLCKTIGLKLQSMPGQDWQFTYLLTYLLTYSLLSCLLQGAGYYLKS